MKKNSLKKKWSEMPVAAKASFAYAISSIFQRALSIITLPLFTRLLTTEQYGQATIYSSWSAIITIFVTLQLPYGSFSTAMIKYENMRNEYIASVEGICLLCSSFFIAIYIPLKDLWNKLFELPTGIVICMILEILAGAGISFWSGKKRFEFKYKEVIAVTLLSSVLSVLVQYFLVMITDEKGYARIIGGATVNILFGGTIFLYNLYRGKKLFNRDFWSYAFSFNIPLLAYYLSQMIFNSSDRIMIGHIVGTDKAAVYGVAYNLAILMNFVLTAIYNSYIPWIYGKIKEGKQDENKTVSLAIAFFMSVLLLGIIWFAPEIMYILADKEYMEAIWIVPPVAMSVLLLFYSQLSISFEFYFEKKKSLVLAAIGSAAMNIVLNAIFIPVFGFYAAGYTTLISYAFFVIFNYLAMKELLKEKKITSCGFDIRTLSLVFAGFMIAGFVGMALYKAVFIRITIAAVFFAIVLLNKNIVEKNIGIISKIKI